MDQLNYPFQFEVNNLIKSQQSILIVSTLNLSCWHLKVEMIEELEFVKIN